MSVPGGKDGRPEPAGDFVQGKPQPVGQPPPANWRRWARMTAWGVLALMVILFIVRNSQSVPVSFVFFTATIPLWIALTGVLIIGLILGYLAAWWGARQRRRRRREQA